LDWWGPVEKVLIFLTTLVAPSAYQLGGWRLFMIALAIMISAYIVTARLLG